MIENFEAHRSELDSLATMLREDAPLSGVWWRILGPGPSGVGLLRTYRYRWLMYRSHIGDGVLRSSGAEVAMAVERIASVGDMRRKAYVWRAVPPYRLASDVDSVNCDYGVSCRHLDGQWYICVICGS